MYIELRVTYMYMYMYIEERLSFSCLGQECTISIDTMPSEACAS